ncbi:Aste57867_17335 [Aphanomyces stellatus]|uniref:Aste57867_17335 protein n=1 Tax=Aphanomyces stellatus TaxID=120398 RepID=A0A485KIV1_9STRA|nr:hypothetical protein As57867_017276 [Aphanomyces stellatus]KAF0701925.1 hypothetical protein As57867_007807 [Aphanomyces stellatus]VFT84733.1 Aste57867_7837 [Aphanomyces stellatus]VFT94091.1 Aste57867_17335 [Aphanomyces stellatus]
MSSHGKRNENDDELAGTKFFFMHSWSQDEYYSALQEQAFWDLVVDKFDATSPSEVNEETQLTDEENLETKIDLKYYYAGGSCRFMFQYPTEMVKEVLQVGINSTRNGNDLLNYCRCAFYVDEMDMLFGMNEKHERFAVSEYAFTLLANISGVETIAELSLYTSKKSSLVGFYFEWMFFASFPRRQVQLLGMNSVNFVLPRAAETSFDPKQDFRTSSQGGQ